jgi:hypothetical protein
MGDHFVGVTRIPVGDFRRMNVTADNQQTMGRFIPFQKSGKHTKQFLPLFNICI